MTHKKEELENIINEAVRAVHEDKPDDAMISESAARVWARIGHGVTETAVAGSTAELISGCADFQSLIPAYLAGELSDARVLLLEDHTGECLPCRRALKDLRQDAVANTGNTRPAVQKSPVQPLQLRHRNRSKLIRWSAAAAILLCAGFAGLFAFERFDWSGRTLAATLEDATGEVFVVSDNSAARPLTPGAQIRKGERVRTAKDSAAMLKLADGSTIEMRERSEFSVSENRRGVTVALDRGDIIIEAAKQDRGRLYVKTPDSLVSVKGTIFAVESGTKGSRVSVVEGEVKVRHAGRDETLLPGDQTTTESLKKKTVGETISWSRQATKYTTLVAELAALRREINDRVQLPGVRYSSNLAALVPEQTVFFAALPNLTETLVQSEQIMTERINENAVLAEWWNARKGDRQRPDELAFAQLREIGGNLGNEIVIAADKDLKGVLVLAEVTNPEGLRAAALGSLAAAGKNQTDLPKLKFVTDSNVTAEKGELLVWLNGNIVAVSSEPALLRGLAQRESGAGNGQNSSTSFLKRINDAYSEGVGILIAADLENLGEKMSEAKDRATLDGLGISKLRYFVAEQKTVDGRTLSRADISFGEERQGIASLLARPASMGALNYFSSDASAVAAVVVKQPALLVDDLTRFISTTDPDFRGRLDEIQKTEGFDIRRDFAEPLGGEFAFALDGPVLPTPSWKAVFEVYDATRLQTTLEQAVTRLNQHSAENGGKQLVWENSTTGSRTFYSIKSPDAGLAVHYVYSDGYMILASSRALLEQSLQIRESGNNIMRSARFMSALPRDGNVNFSALFYHDLAPVLAPIAERMQKSGGELNEEQRRALSSIAANAPPTLVYAYAGDDRITIATNADGGAFGLDPASLVGIPNSFEMENILTSALKEGGGAAK